MALSIQALRVGLLCLLFALTDVNSAIFNGAMTKVQALRTVKNQKQQNSQQKVLTEATRISMGSLNGTEIRKKVFKAYTPKGYLFYEVEYKRKKNKQQEQQNLNGPDQIPPSQIKVTIKENPELLDINPARKENYQKYSFRLPFLQEGPGVDDYYINVIEVWFDKKAKDQNSSQVTIIFDNVTNQSVTITKTINNQTNFKEFDINIPDFDEAYSPPQVLDAVEKALPVEFYYNFNNGQFLGNFPKVTYKINRLSPISPPLQQCGLDNGIFNEDVFLQCVRQHYIFFDESKIFKAMLNKNEKELWVQKPSVKIFKAGQSKQAGYTIIQQFRSGFQQISQTPLPGQQLFEIFPRRTTSDQGPVFSKRVRIEYWSQTQQLTQKATRISETPQYNIYYKYILARKLSQRQFQLMKAFYWIPDITQIGNLAAQAQIITNKFLDSIETMEIIWSQSTNPLPGIQSSLLAETVEFI